MNRYQDLPMIVRILLASIPAIGLAIYLYLHDGEARFQQLAQVKQEDKEVQTKLTQAIDEKSQLPSLEQSQSDLEQKLSAAKRRLPEFFKMEQILEQVAMAAKDQDLDLMRFEPEKELFHEGKVKFVEQPILLHLKGTYVQIAKFFDQITHLDEDQFGFVHVRDYKLSRITDIPETYLAKIPDESLSDLSLQARTFSKVAATAHLALYRTVRVDEILNPETKDTSKEDRDEGEDEDKETEDSTEEKAAESPKGAETLKVLEGEADKKT